MEYSDSSVNEIFFELALLALVAKTFSLQLAPIQIHCMILGQAQRHCINRTKMDLSLSNNFTGYLLVSFRQ